jgi:hypothetical protein
MNLKMRLVVCLVMPHKVSRVYIGCNAKAVSVINFLHLEIPITDAIQV